MVWPNGWILDSIKNIFECKKLTPETIENRTNN